MRVLSRLYLAIPLFILLQAGCNRTQQATGDDVRVKVPVTVTGIEVKTLTDYLELTATSKFLNKSIISAHATGYIQQVFHNPGEKVTKGQELFILQTKEAAALSADSANKSEFQGLIHVKAAIDGMIISIDHPEGDFVMEGESLGSISVPASLVFILNVPFESTSNIKINSTCEILLPDGDSIQAYIGSRLPSMSESPQTQQYIVNPRTTRDIPENLIAKIRVIKKTVPGAVTLPKSCVLSDEVMKRFWVMKLVNDTTAVRVDVEPGLIEGDDIEITGPPFSAGDVFLASGNYGVSDTLTVKVMGKMDSISNE
jgi:multidrug efflux pump subunit AcrA (membrane-fusion protein)